MIIIDRVLQERQEQGRPIRIGLVGIGTMGSALLSQIAGSVPGIEVTAIASRTLSRIVQACDAAGISRYRLVDTLPDLKKAVEAREMPVTDIPELLCELDQLDAVVDATGSVEFGAELALKAFAHGKHLISFNAELDSTVGTVLRLHAEKAGVIYTLCDGDQPGVEMNLWRYIRGLGMEPLVCGNIKGLQDIRRTPATQQEFARKWNQNPYMVTSFADGSKLSMEQSCVANATGMCVEMRGMRGGDFSGHVDDLCQGSRYDIDRLRELGGVVDYVVGAHPAPGIFILAACDDSSSCRMLELYKMGSGPLYSFYTPYHLCHFEVPFSIARAVHFGDVVIQAKSPRVDVITCAKRPLGKGETIDAIGGYMTYGLCENHDISRSQRLLPQGLSEGCVLIRDLPMDAVVTYNDVKLPEGRLSDALRAEQDRLFPIDAGP